MTRYLPDPDEIAVVRLAPGERATVATAEGDVEIHGEQPGEWAGNVVAYVPHTAGATGWDPQTRSFTTNVTRIDREKHPVDRPTWVLAEKLLRKAGAVFVRHDTRDYYGRPRITALSIRHAITEEPTR